MKKTILIMTILVVALTSLGLFAACEKKDADVLYIATNAEFPPFEYLDGGKPVGFDIDLANALAKEMGYKEAKIMDMKFEAIVGSVQQGECQIAIAGLTIDPKKDASFSDAYYKAAQVVIYKGAKQEFADEDALVAFLKDKKIGVCLGYSGNKLVDGYIADELIGTAKTEVYDNGTLAVAALAADTVDCVVIDQEPAKKLVEASPNASELVVSEQTLGKEEYGVMCKKGDTEMVAKVNAALKAIKEKKVEDGSQTIYDSIYFKYFKAEK